MTRREHGHHYSQPGIYHITLHVADGLGQPLGTVVPSECPAVPCECPVVPPQGSSPITDATVALTPLGQMVQQELLTAITAHYPMITVDTYVVMPEHLHFILIVHNPIVSQSGRPAHLGQVLAGYKLGCNRRYWAMTEQAPLTVEPQGTPSAPSPRPSSSITSKALKALRVPGGSTARVSTVSGRPPLFAYGYCDVIPFEPGQLDQQRTYIKNNPFSRWLRSHDPNRLQRQRGAIHTALTVPALRGFLQRECPPSLATPAALSEIECRLLLADVTITCDSYGDLALLQKTLLPVVCHRKCRQRFDEQKRRCLDAAAQGAVLVSARIAPGEREIIDAAIAASHPVVLIADNGFPTPYHPSATRIDLCAKGRLLLVTPWQYQYRGKNEKVSVAFCKAMNCVAQALCRLKDSWWQQP